VTAGEVQIMVSQVSRCSSVGCHNFTERFEKFFS